MKPVSSLALLLPLCLGAPPAPAAAPMMTPWGERVTPGNAWRDYPRPQMVRRGPWTNLNGEWDYAVTAVTNTAGRPSAWQGRILVPFAVESPLSGVGRRLEPDEFLWYTRRIDVRKTPGTRTILHFESVDFRAQVFVGHREVALHESMNAPFSVDITDAAAEGENELTVCVWDPTDAGAFGSTGKQFLSPRSCFFSRCSGIVGTVWAETVPEVHVTDCRVTPDLAGGRVRFRVLASGWREAAFRVEVLDGGAVVARGAGTVGEEVEVAMPAGFRPWTPESPHLYGYRVTLGRDAVDGYFAMRSFGKVRDGRGVLRFALNGRPAFIASTLDQGWWPDGLLTPPSAEALAFEIGTLKRCGFNAVRKHIKVEPRVFYALCDRMGLMVLQDMPSDPPRNDGARAPDNGFATDTVRYGFYRRDLWRVVDHLYSVPSLAMWVPYNESWGQPGPFLTHATLDWVRWYDPTRPVDGPSGWNDYEGGTLRLSYDNWTEWGASRRPGSGACEAADAVDSHDYARRPAAPAATGRRISLLGEIGGIDLKVPGHLWEGRGSVAVPPDVTAAGQQGAYVELMEHVAGLAERGLSGFVYTQTSDVETETCGLLTYDRRVLKFDPDVLRAAHERVRAAAEAAGD